MIVSFGLKHDMILILFSATSVLYNGDCYTGTVEQLQYLLHFEISKCFIAVISLKKEKTELHFAELPFCQPTKIMYKTI